MRELSNLHNELQGIRILRHYKFHSKLLNERNKQYYCVKLYKKKWMNIYSTAVLNYCGGLRTMIIITPIYYSFDR